MPKKIYTCLILAGICFLVYANSLPNAFISDDITAILENADIAHPLKFLFDPQGLLNSLIYKIAGFNAFPYHLASVILHIANTLLVFYLLRLFFAPEASFFSAMLFAVHPIHTEAASWISGRGYLFLAFFTFISYLLYYKATELHNTKNKRLYYILSLAIFSYFIIGSYSYLLFPFFIIFSDILFNHIKKKWKLWLPFFMLMLLRFLFLGRILQERLAFTLAYKPAEISTWRNPVFPFIYSIFMHLRLLFWPAKLTFFHEPIVFYPLAMWLGLIALLILAFFIPYLFRKTKIILFGIGLFIIFLAPTYSPLPIASVVAERYAYLPSVFLSILFAFLYERYSQKRHKNIIWLNALFILLIAGYGLRTIIRNADWKNPKIFWQATLKVSPYSPWAHNNMGIAYLQEGNIAKAIEEFNITLKLNPNLAEAYNNLGRAYQDSNNLDGAISDYAQAIRINPNFTEAYNNRGIAYKNKGDFDKAISDYNRALKLNPNLAEVYYNRANAYYRKNDLNQAISDYNQAIKINPYPAQFYANRGAVYLLKKEYNRAWDDIGKAQALGYKFSPEFINRLKNLSENN